MFRCSTQFRIASFALIFGLAGPVFAQGDAMTDKEKAGYAVGVQFGQALAGAEEFIDLDAMIQAMRDVVGEEDLKLSQQELQQAMAAFQQQLQQVRTAELEAAGAESREAGEKFLEENAQRDEVVVLDSGLQYEVIEPGSGESPAATSTVSTHYRGELIDGTVFDSSYDRGQPATFPVNRVIPGWTEAVRLMKPGAKWKLYIPFDMAYGPQGNPPAIPPYSTLVFDVELLEVVEQ